ncbi:antA/AntB antirepressor family protein [Anaerotruncus rubiinfantis]|uniref:antA/AntB antirepressor family protein n=1 Tax=Anaerotruncus rubiinfantis TaxID=1720200 RepID=UPI00082BB0E9|nr:antA/AntB antirepressor family protein [Anaerotruncus rubiinfantis]
MKRFDEMTTLESSIIPIYEKNCIDGSNQHEQVVNARELWEALGVGRDFSNWIKGRLAEIDAVENVDFCLLAKSGEQSTRGGSNKIDYILTMDTAKEMAMLERSEKGKMIRRYFIEAEKRYRELKFVRVRSKAERRLFTDIIKELIPESPNKRWAYKQFTDLVYKHVTGYNAKQLRELHDKPNDFNVRELLTPQQLKEVIKYESIIQGLLNLGQDYHGVKAILDNPAAYLPAQRDAS